MPDTIINVHTFDQPIETSVKVGIEVDSKGQKKPSVEIKITRKLSPHQLNSVDVTVDVLDGDIKRALQKCKETLQKAMEEN